MPQPHDPSAPKEPPDDRRDEGQPVRFQFGLRKLFLLNFLAACVLSGIRVLEKGNPGREILSPCIWPFGALSVIIMAVVGDVVGRDWGVVVGSLVGVGIWCAMLGALHFANSEVPLGLFPHLLAIVVTLAAILAPVLLRLRRQAASEREMPLATRLLLGQRRRRKHRQR